MTSEETVVPKRRGRPPGPPKPPKPPRPPKPPSKGKPKGIKTGGSLKGSSHGLTPQMAKFVDLYCGGMAIREACIQVGMSPASAHTRGYKWLHDNQAVMAAVREYRLKCQEKTGYRQQEAMAEAQAAIEFAISTENANAYVKAVELRAKLAGLLDPQEGLKSAFQINIVGLSQPGATNLKVIDTKEFSIFD